MTSTIIERAPINFGSKSGVAVILNVTGYSTGGEDVSPRRLGMESSRVPYIINIIPSNDQNPFFATHDRTNNKLLLYVPQSGNEVMGGTNVGLVEVIAIGNVSS